MLPANSIRGAVPARVVPGLASSSGTEPFSATSTLCVQEDAQNSQVDILHRPFRFWHRSGLVPVPDTPGHSGHTYYKATLARRSHQR